MSTQFETIYILLDVQVNTVYIKKDFLTVILWHQPKSNRLKIDVLNGWMFWTVVFRSKFFIVVQGGNLRNNIVVLYILNEWTTGIFWQYSVIFVQVTINISWVGNIKREICLGNKYKTDVMRSNQRFNKSNQRI